MNSTRLSDSWEQGNPYERYIGRWSRQVAPRFLDWLNYPAGRRWLDIGCGTGALSAAIVDHCAPRLAAGVELSRGFLKTAQENLAGRALLFQGAAARLPFAPASVDAVVSGLVLNFIPDQPAALAEMVRVTVRGGLIGAYLWDYAGQMELIRLFWEAVVDLNPGDAWLDEGTRFPVCRPEALAALFSRAGLREVTTTAIDLPTRFASFDDYWQPFLGGQGPAPAYVAALNAADRDRLRDHLRQRLPLQADGAISLVARAWAIRGTVV